MSWVPLRLPKKFVKRIISRINVAFVYYFIELLNLFQGQFLCIACFWSSSCSVILMKAWRSVWQTQFIFSSHKSEFFILSWCFNHLKVVGSNEEDKLSKSTHTDALPQDWHPRPWPRDRWRGHEAELPQPLILRSGPSLSARSLPALRI